MFCMFLLLFAFERCSFTKDSGIKLVLDGDSNYRVFCFFSLDWTWSLSHGVLKGKGKSNFCFDWRKTFCCPLFLVPKLRSNVCTLCLPWSMEPLKVVFRPCDLGSSSSHTDFTSVKGSSTVLDKCSCLQESQYLNSQQQPGSRPLSTLRLKMDI